MNNAMRDTAIREIGCICCHKRGYMQTPCEKHHFLVSGKHGNGRRRGEAETVGLCPYHHRGKAAVGSADALRLYVLVGPSYADRPLEFREKFGSDDELLEYQNNLIAQWRRSFVTDAVGSWDAAT